MGTQQDFTTPVGRLVQGDCFTPQTKNQAGQPLLDKNNQPTQKYFVAVAFSKTDPAFAAIKAQFEAIGRAAFPQFFQGPGGACTHPSFSLKIIDGDGIDNNGKPNSAKEGFAGCWIIRASSTYPPKCFAAGKYAAHEQLQMVGGVNPIPRGHYVRISGTVCDNGGGNGKPGLYVNCNLIEWSRIGDVIVSGPDAASVFGGAPGYAAPAAPMAPPAPQPMAGHVAPPPMAPAPVAPYPGILAGPQMTALATASYAQYIAGGWTEAQLIAGGYMIPPNAASLPMAPGSTPVAPPPAPIAVAPPPALKRMTHLATATYEQYIAGGWNDAQMIAQGVLAA